jgi:peptidoglycan/LPS O-acetylase OafA/YrhL
VSDRPETPRRKLIFLQPTQRGDVLDLLAGVLAVGLLELVDEGGTGLLRVLLALAFAFFVPGRAIVANWPSLGRWSDVGMSMVLSLAVLTLVAMVILWSKYWHPVYFFQGEALASVAALIVSIVRRHRRARTPEAGQAAAAAVPARR